MSFKPIFEKGMIIRQHMLEALRDYPYDFVQILFSQMGDGVISGCKISVDSRERFTVSPGIVKINGELFFLTDQATLEFMDGINYVYIETRKEQAVDGTFYDAQIIEKKEQDESLFELFRYTRNAFVKEYSEIYELWGNVINRIDRRFSQNSVSGGSTLCEDYYKLFARYLLSQENADMRDVSFAYQCLDGVNCLDIIKAYFKIDELSNKQVIQLMKSKVQSLGQMAGSDAGMKTERKAGKKMYIS